MSCNILLLYKEPFGFQYCMPSFRKKLKSMARHSNVWFQKISIPPPRRESEIPRGWAKTQEIQEGRGG